MVNIEISRKARKDLDTIKEYIARDNPNRAEKFSHELLESCISTISLFPQSCPIWNKKKNIRCYIYHKYNIYYRYNEVITV